MYRFTKNLIKFYKYNKTNYKYNTNKNHSKIYYNKPFSYGKFLNENQHRPIYKEERLKAIQRFLTETR